MGTTTIPLNQSLLLLCAKDQCVKCSEWSVNWNKNYWAETIVSTDRRTTTTTNPYRNTTTKFLVVYKKKTCFHFSINYNVLH